MTCRLFQDAKKQECIGSSGVLRSFIMRYLIERSFHVHTSLLSQLFLPSVPIYLFSISGVITAVSSAMDEPGESSPLEDLLARSGVPAILSSRLLAEGWTLDSFARSATSMTQFDDILPELLPSEEVSLLHKAALRLAFKQANSLPSSSSGGPGPSSGPSGQSDSQSWVETCAPKLEAETIRKLKATFLSNYPSELLSPETMPSTRLLSLVHHQLAKRQWHWIPWKFRLSASKAEEISQQRSAKIPKLDSVTLQSLLCDDPPSIEISNQGMGLHAMRTMFDVHNLAIALCNGAHLATLKGYTQKFMSFVTQKVDAETGLRTASILECQAADRHVWQQVSDLMLDRNWSMDDALYEFTHIRHELPSLLQLRPRLPKPQQTPFFKGAGPKGLDHKGKGKGKSKFLPKGGKSRPQWVTELWKDGKMMQLCMRYQTNKCTVPNCRFLHACAFPKGDQTACGGDRSALDHSKVPH